MNKWSTAFDSSKSGGCSHCAAFAPSPVRPADADDGAGRGHTPVQKKVFSLGCCVYVKKKHVLCRTLFSVAYLSGDHNPAFAINR